MDGIQHNAEVLSVASMALLLLLNVNRALQTACTVDVLEEAFDDGQPDNEMDEPPALDVNHIAEAALQHWRLWTTLSILDEDMGFWVKPRSTTWFSRFLLQEYEDARWVQMFRMTKSAVFMLSDLLLCSIVKKDTNYRPAIPVLVRVVCSLFKLSHGTSLLVCSELFAVGCSTVSVMLHDVVNNINIVLRAEITWPRGHTLNATAAAFREMCGLPGVVGAIDGTHIHMRKPQHATGEYYYFKSGGYSMNCQAVVDSKKRFLDMYVGMPGSTNDTRMLRKSVLFHKAQRNELWDAGSRFGGFTPYLLGDSGYPLLPWLMVPHRQSRTLPVADALFNRKLSRGRGVVENAFALLKQSFKELHCKSELKVTFLPDVVIACALLHNLLLKQSAEDVEHLLEVLRTEQASCARRPQAPEVPAAVADTVDDDGGHAAGVTKRRELGLLLASERMVFV